MRLFAGDFPTSRWARSARCRGFPDISQFIVRRTHLSRDFETLFSRFFFAPRLVWITLTTKSMRKAKSFNLLVIGLFNAHLAGATIVPLSPTNGAAGVAQSPTLTVSVSAPTNNLTVTFYGRAKNMNPNFTIIALPDTQYYTSGLNGGTAEMFYSQTDWVVAHRADSNIVYVAHEGDITEFGNWDGEEWRLATNALYRLENPATTGLSNGIPYGVLAGNHDLFGGSANYSHYFGAPHFQGRSYYGCAYDVNNLNHYDLFSAGGLDFIVICLSYDQSATDSGAAVYTWAKNVLQTNSNRRAIVVSHDILNAGDPAPFDPQGQAIYNALKSCTNLFLMLCGHNDFEARRADTNNGCVVYSLMADYQDRPDGGEGLLRIYQFSPTNNVIHTRTYSPWTGEYETDSDSQFEIAYDLGGPWMALATNAGVASGSSTSASWPGLIVGKQYEWYVTVNSGNVTTSGPAWFFTTLTMPAPVLRIASPGVTTNGLVTITWSSVGGTRYRVSCCDGNAVGGFTGVFTDIVRSVNEETDPAPMGTASTQSFTDPNPPSANKARYYRVQVVR